MSTPELLSEKIALYDRNSGLSEESRQKIFDRMLRFAELHEQLLRVSVELEPASPAAATTEFVAKGHVDLGGPGLFTSVRSPSPDAALEALLHKFESQLRRQRRHLRLPAVA